MKAPELQCCSVADLALQHSNGPEHTTQLARELAASLKPGDVILLEGELGAGKSTFARALIQALCGENTEVPSPTFTLVQTYETARFPVSHYDLYRLKRSSELDELGLEEALDDGAALIEWPERAEDRLPSDALRVHLLADNERCATMAGPARWRGLEAAYV